MRRLRVLVWQAWRDRWRLPYRQRRRALQALRNNQVTMDRPDVGSVGPLLASRSVLLTGSARSGKTSLIRDVAAACRAAGWPVAVTAMTGKAAGGIGLDAMTVHRLLEYGRRGYAKSVLPYDLLVINESSMATWPVISAALSVMPGRIIFSGDARQLPPVEGEAADA